MLDCQICNDHRDLFVTPIFFDEKSNRAGLQCPIKINAVHPTIASAADVVAMRLFNTVVLVLLFGECCVVWANTSLLCKSDWDCKDPNKICNFRGRCVADSEDAIEKSTEKLEIPTKSTLPVYDPSVKTEAELKAPTFGHRCAIDEDCTLPGTRCDLHLGRCGLDPRAKLEKPTVSPLTCFSQASPRMPMIKEKCDGVHGTGSHISQDERNKIVDFVSLGIPKPASNYRKVKYNCELESESQFECNYKVEPETFMSDEKTWRSFDEKQDSIYRQAIFRRLSPLAYQLQINTSNLMVENVADEAVFIKLFMSEDVTEVGCFVKVCGGHEFIACKTDHDYTVPQNAPLYTSGHRCNVDSDCTHPGYTTCDATVGLCDYKSQTEIRVESISSKCENVRNVYIDSVTENCNPGEHYTGSEMSKKERDIIVYTVNHFRALVNNECDLGNGTVKPVTNYRKVKYNCALEQQASLSFLSWNSESFESSRRILRYARPKVNDSRTAIFVAGAPRTQDMLIDPDTQTSEADDEKRSYLRFMLSPDVTEIGCYVETSEELEYMACTTQQVIKAPNEKPLYTPGKRCVIDEDCTLPGYERCDIVTGLCDIKPQSRRVADTRNNVSKCDDISQVYVERVSEKCSPHYDTGSDMSIKEREAIVNVANQFRALINNYCDLGLGNVNPITEYRKLKYSCRLEEDVGLECDDPNLATFKTDSSTWRRVAQLGMNRTRPLFLTGTPRNHDLLIEPDDKAIESSEDIKYFLRLVLNPLATEIGCFTKVSETNQIYFDLPVPTCEYYACKSDYEIAGSKYMGHIYSGKRCNVDSDCTKMGYRICDIESGMCEPS
uniref:SCP domain-containing protein n=1 Tax=Panagrellus redivivus TaxID=6233 RepID=A0A7E4W014_PANRE